MRLLLILLLVVLIAAVGGAVHGWRLLNQPVNLPTESMELEVQAGETLSGVLRRLEAVGAVHSPRQVVWAARVGGLDLGIKAGEYLVTSGIPLTALVTQLVEGRTVLHALTIVEGWTFNQMRRAMEAHPALEQTLTQLDSDSIMTRLNRPGVHPEGRFFPDTYLFSRGVTDLAFLERALLMMDRKLEEAWAARDGGLPYDTPFDALIMASIIEREAKIAAERPIIAGVFVRRLQRGMRLQTDPTVMYGVSPDFTDRLRTHHLRTDTPYNTYTRHGLPPTPIAMPGAGALEAAMRPSVGEYLYFVAKGDGSHHFSVTLEEHNRAVARYQLGRQVDGSRTER